MLKYVWNPHAQSLARHILEVAPKSARVLFENEVVRVIEITLSKGQKIPMHSHNKGLSYSLNGGRIRSNNADGRSEVIKVKKGEVSWSDRDGAETHAVENLGGVLRELSIEFKN
jgi:quercetin dioxygenase-like cupin family protein